MLSMCYKCQKTFSLLSLFSQFRPRDVPRDPWALTPGAKEDMRGIGMVIFRGHLRARQNCCSIAQGRPDICQESDREIVMSDKGEPVGSASPQWKYTRQQDKSRNVFLGYFKTMRSPIRRPLPQSPRNYRTRKLFCLHCRPNNRY